MVPPDNIVLSGVLKQGQNTLIGRLTYLGIQSWLIHINPGMR